MPHRGTWKRMRSGDRPGLQNRRAASFGVAGGFDSHSLPPVFNNLDGAAQCHSDCRRHVIPGREDDQLRRQVEIPSKGCGGEAEAVEEIFTVNGAVCPRIEIAPNEQQFWRIVNASPDRYLDLQLDGQTLEIVALDGMPLAYHRPDGPTRTTDHLLL